MILFFIRLIIAYLPFFCLQVRLVWKSNWGIGNILFLLTRYSAFVDVPLTVWRTSTRSYLDVKKIHQ
jgi:hypothetical protein